MRTTHDEIDPGRSAQPIPSPALEGEHRHRSFLLAVSATIPAFETPDAPRYRELMTLHSGKAAECRRLEREARSAGRVEEARLLAQSAQNFEQFAATYRVQLAENPLGCLAMLASLYPDRGLP